MSKGKKQKIVLLAFVALFIGAIGLIINFIIKSDILDRIIQFFFFSVAALVSFDIVKDGKPFFSSFYKIAYTLSVVIAAVFIILPFILDIVKVLKG